MLLITSVKEFQATPRQGQEIFVIVLVDAQFMKKLFCEDLMEVWLSRRKKALGLLKIRSITPNRGGRKEEVIERSQR